VKPEPGLVRHYGVMRGLVFVTVVGCAGASAKTTPPAAKTEVEIGPPLLFADETMVYGITFRGISVASVRVAVGKPGWVDGRPAIIIKAKGATEGLLTLIGDIDWQMETTIDTELGKPIRAHEIADVKVVGETRHIDRDAGVDKHNVLSAVAALRGWRSQPNQETSVPIRIDRLSLDAQLRETAHEFLDAQDKPAVRYDGTAAFDSKVPITMWLSDDLARVPLAMRASTEWGAIGVELVEYEAPRD
jgi:hypothetical protein